MSNTRSKFEQLAISSCKPAFEKALPVGQLYFPDWSDYEAAFRGIFKRQYYTNHGPLAQELEARLAEYLGVKHVICTTNATIALIMATECLNLTGKVIVPSFTFVATAQALSWANLQPVFCDINRTAYRTRRFCNLSRQSLGRQLRPRSVAGLGGQAQSAAIL
jgi:dTDP-4-amino-4,6-dideoxygalactose transaminase